MNIQTLAKTYIVTEYCYADTHLVRYLCREKGKKQIYSMVCIKDKSWIQGVTKFLMEQMENPYFTDYISCFFSQECLYVLMKYQRGLSMRQAFENVRFDLEERMAIGTHLLEKILLLNMPDYFLQDCLHIDRVMVSPALEVGFRYEMSDIHQYKSYGFQDVQKGLERIFRALYEQEIKKDMLPAVREFCDGLCRGGYADILEIYEAYQKLCESIERMTPEKRTQPGTRGFRIWEKIRRQIAPLKKICGAVLFLMALVFLVYTLCQAAAPGGEKQIFTSIGTLKIRQSGSDMLKDSER